MELPHESEKETSAVAMDPETPAFRLRIDAATSTRIRTQDPKENDLNH